MDDKTLKLPQDGIIFLKCTWSESMLYLKYLQNIMREMPEIELYICDIDGPPYVWFQEKYSFTSHGKGETFWVWKGEIIGRILDYDKETDKVQKLNKELLSKIRG